jgi:hypothetical protein
MKYAGKHCIGTFDNWYPPHLPSLSNTRTHALRTMTPYQPIPSYVSYPGVKAISIWPIGACLRIGDLQADCLL